MKFQDIHSKATKLHSENLKSRYYEMVLYFGLEDLDEENLEIITEKDIYTLLSLMENYLDGCYYVSPYEVADSIIICINRMGLKEFLDSNMEQELIDELCSH